MKNIKPGVLMAYDVTALYEKYNRDLDDIVFGDNTDIIYSER